jgi:putative two-component system response regulator
VREVSVSDLGRVLVVDDEASVLESTCAWLSSCGYSVTACSQSPLASQKVREQDFDVVLSDIKMPGMTGLELLEAIRAIDSDLPVVLMTAFAELEIALNAITMGAFDFVLKPWNPNYLTLRIEKAVKYHRLVRIEKEYKKTLEETVQARTRELVDALEMVKGLNREVVQRLISVTEFRDSETGAHVVRIGKFTRCIAEAMSMPPDFVQAIEFASPMHDIGKIGVPDSILLKPGPLTPDEIEVMKTHTAIGERILGASMHSSIQMAASIAHCHHERHDGTGYPRELKGDEIPIEARITLLCDQYDALTSERPYKNAFEHSDAVRIICEGDGRTLPSHFHPDVLKTFTIVADQLREIRLASQASGTD